MGISSPKSGWKLAGRLPSHSNGCSRCSRPGPAIRWSIDWIAQDADASAVVVTADILLADRCLKAGAQVLGPNGKPFTTSSIGGAIATRAIMADLRAGGDAIGGPPPFRATDRSRFLSALDAMLVTLKRRPA